MPITPPHDMPDFEKMASARFCEARVITEDFIMPPGRLGVQPSRCSNPNCEDGCPSVWLQVQLDEQALDIRIDAHIAVVLAALILHSAHFADPKLKEGAN